MSATLKRWLQIMVMLGLLAVACPVHAFYNPSTGRWLSRDPLGESGFESLRGGRANPLGGGQNLDAFVGNHPIDSFDVDGLLKRCQSRLLEKMFGPCDPSRRQFHHRSGLQ